ncbi:MAG: MSCRAMM family adhesin SdrC [Firmicutes bacterium]|nr:MSCRAMM family adhesin SdrC [Bacillota bacterium]
MRKIIIGSACFLVACTIFAFIIGEKNKSLSHDEQPIQTTEKQLETNKENRVGYIVKDYNGKVSAFEIDSDKPFNVTDSKTSDLPKVDQNRLKSGIKVETYEELCSILEDYCS